MANEQFAFIEKAKVPSRQEWQAAIDASGYDFQLDPDLMPFENSGFLPCKLNGKDAGFEIYYDGSEEMLGQFADIIENKDYCISFRWGGNMLECASVLIASYALAKYFDAIVSYEGEEPKEDIEAFRSAIQEAIKYAATKS